MSVEPSKEALLQLLELQKVDSLIDRLESRLRNLPEQAELDGLEERLAGLDKSLGEQQAIVDDIRKRQEKFDTEIEMISSKIKKEDERLYSGKIANPKELADIQEEIGSLKRRQGSLEESDLAVMEERESAEKLLEELTSESSDVRAQIEETTNRRDHASGDVGTQLTAARSERSGWIPTIDPELLELYDDLRASKAGVGAAALLDGVCQGCHMRLPSQWVEQVRKATGLVRCDECRRILVVLE